MGNNDSGRMASPPGSREPSPDGLGPSGFDPSRFDAEMLGWLRACQPEREQISGSDFSQGVVRGFEIVIAQIENGHHWKYVTPPLSPSILVDILADLEAAIVLTSEHNPSVTVGSFADSSIQFKRLRDFLHSIQYADRDSDGSPKGGDACGSVHDSASPKDIAR